MRNVMLNYTDHENPLLVILEAIERFVYHLFVYVDYTSTQVFWVCN